MSVRSDVTMSIHTVKLLFLQPKTGHNKAILYSCYILIQFSVIPGLYEGFSSA